MFIIASAAYITSGLISEFGKIPPSFLPLQNKRLFKHQIYLAKSEETKILSLPKGFELSISDEEYLKENNIKIIYVPVGLSLGQSIVYVLNVAAKYNDTVKILHGDTLFTCLPEGLDLYVTAKTSDNYAWAKSVENNEEGFIYAGYFSFSDQSKLIQLITEYNYNFIDAIIKYKEIMDVMEVFIDNWTDFGHANTYYRSKAHLTTQRCFNELKIDTIAVKKYSMDSRKIQAEAQWYSKIPPKLKHFVPSLWDSGCENGVMYYEMEYVYLTTLAELFVFGDNEYFIWQNILNACEKFIAVCAAYKAPLELNIADSSLLLYGNKTLKRLEEYSGQTGIDLAEEWNYNNIKLPSLLTIIEDIDGLITKPPDEYQTIIHGDFGFSNIFYDFRTQAVKVIDPRGVDFNGNITIYGDIRYDIAKLAHSVLGLYDFIVAGYFVYEERNKYNIHFELPNNEKIKKIQDYFKQRTMLGMTLKDACTYPILIHLFLSMLPLHRDNPRRQRALLANALRLYVELKTRNNDDNNNSNGWT